MVNQVVIATHFARIQLARTLVNAGLVTWEMDVNAFVSIELFEKCSNLSIFAFVLTFCSNLYVRTGVFQLPQKGRKKMTPGILNSQEKKL